MGRRKNALRRRRKEQKKADAAFNRLSKTMAKTLAGGSAKSLLEVGREYFEKHPDDAKERLRTLGISMGTWSKGRERRGT